MTYKIKEKHIKDIIQGDLILIGGRLKVVCNSDITYGSKGLSLYGYNYNYGERKVKTVFNLKFN